MFFLNIEKLSNLAYNGILLYSLDLIHATNNAKMMLCIRGLNIVVFLEFTGVLGICSFSRNEAFMLNLAFCVNMHDFSAIFSLYNVHFLYLVSRIFETYMGINI